MINRDDEYILSKAREGDKPAFEEFYQKYKSQIFNYIYRFVHSYELAEELTQEAFINAYTHLGKYSEKGKPLAWLYKIAGNLSKNALRSKTRKSEISLETPLQNSDGQLNISDTLEDIKQNPNLIIRNKELVSKIQDAIDVLPVEEREILLLCDVQGQSYQDVAHILGCKVTTVGSKLFRARKKIAKKLANLYQVNPRKWFRWKDADFLHKDYPST